MHTKNLYENGPNPFFSGFFNLMGTRMVQIRMPNPFELFVTGQQTDLVPVCSSDTNLQTDFARGATITTFG